MQLARAPRTAHHLSGSHHFHFDNSLEPALKVRSGDVVVFECKEAYGGELTSDSTTEDLTNLEFDRVHCLTGPVAVEGAEPGDVLEIEVLDFEHDGWAWTAVFPGIGLLADDFGDAHHLHIWRVGADERAELVPGIRVPVDPFCGVMGVTPREPGAHITLPPRPTGGNLDTRHLVRGSTLYLPVAVPGALFSVGDGHLAQGDGEVCATALEAPLAVTLRFRVQKGKTLTTPQIRTRGPTISRYDGMGYHMTSATGDDLHAAAQHAVREMIRWLETEHALRAGGRLCPLQRSRRPQDFSTEDSACTHRLCHVQHATSRVLGLGVLLSRMETFVLVHGSWHGGWAWEATMWALRERGHRAYAPTYPGHTAGASRRGIRHDHYVTAVSTFVEHLNLRDIVLVGHSFGGSVISRAFQRIPDRIKRLVFHTAFVVEDGGSVNDNLSDEQTAIFAELARLSPDDTVLCPWELFRDNFMQDAAEEEARSVWERLVPQPYRPWVDQLDLKAFYASDVPKSYIAVTDDIALPPGTWHPTMSSRLGDYKLVEIGGSHEIMFTRPGELADKLVEASRD